MVVLKNVKYVYFENLTVIYQIFVQLLRCVLYLNFQGENATGRKGSTRKFRPGYVPACC